MISHFEQPGGIPNRPKIHSPESTVAPKPAGETPALPGNVDTGNHFLVGVRGDHVVILVPPGPMTNAEAINLAAWLAVMADPDGKEFLRTLEAIRKT